MNALMIGMNNIGVLAKNGHLSLDLVEDFCGVYVRMFASRWRRVIHIFMMVNVNKTDEGQESIWGGVLVVGPPGKQRRRELFPKSN